MYPFRARLMGRLCLLFALAGPPAQAADKDGNYAIWGLGQSSCNQFVKASGEQRLEGYKHYVAGYLTGINRMTPGAYGTTGTSSMKDNFSVLLDYCTQNRMDSLEQALQGLLSKAAQSAGHGGAAWGRVPPSP
jgi:hypothetical protein